MTVKTKTGVKNRKLKLAGVSRVPKKVARKDGAAGIRIGDETFFGKPEPAFGPGGKKGGYTGRWIVQVPEAVNYEIPFFT